VAYQGALFYPLAINISNIRHRWGRKHSTWVKKEEYTDLLALPLASLRKAGGEFVDVQRGRSFKGRKAKQALKTKSPPWRANYSNLKLIC